MQQSLVGGHGSRLALGWRWLLFPKLLIVTIRKGWLLAYQSEYMEQSVR